MKRIISEKEMQAIIEILQHLRTKGEQKRTMSKPLSPQRPRQKAKNVSRDKLGKSSGVTSPEHVVQSYNTKRMEDFFRF